MEDYDRIEIAYVFDSEPSMQAYEFLFAGVPKRPRPEYEAGEFNINFSRAIEDADFAEGFDPDSDLRFVSPDETSTIG
jgi:hypothetical protein